MMMKGHALTLVPSGNVSGTWTLANSPYMIQGNVTVPAGSLLEIEPGVQVLFQGYYQLKVLGALYAVGNVADSIRFSVADTTGFSNRAMIQGGWRGIFFENATTDSSFIAFADFSHFKDTTFSGYIYPSPAAISMYLSKKVDIRNTRIHDCISGRVGNALYLEQSHARIHKILVENCIQDTAAYMIQPSDIITLSFSDNVEFDYSEIRNCVGGHILMVNNSDEVIVHHNYIHHNHSNYGGAVAGLAAGQNFKLIIYKNIITHNWGHLAGGGIFLQGLVGYIDANLIANNVSYSKAGWACGFGDGGGAVLVKFAEIFLYNNLMVNNTSFGYGGALNTTNTYVTLINNTICNNKTGMSGIGSGGGIYIAADFTYPNISTYPHKFVNNIFYGNRDTTWVIDTDDQMDLDGSYYNADGRNNQFEAWPSFGIGFPNFVNIDASNPLFVMPSTGVGHTHNGVSANWNLQLLSPCVNRGTPDTTGYSLPLYDYATNFRIINDTVDVGAIELRQEFVSVDEGEEMHIQLSPNPATNLLHIKAPFQWIGKKLTIWDMQGKICKEISLHATQMSIDIHDLPSGIYTLQGPKNQARFVKE